MFIISLIIIATYSTHCANLQYFKVRNVPFATGKENEDKFEHIIKQFTLKPRKLY